MTAEQREARRRYIRITKELTRFMRDNFNVFSREDNKKFDDLMRKLSVASAALEQTNGADR
jgi:hypothetical protein|tara:strand:- start:418 stop:600 length:183 start_codon:yes stop_codon:yes gene_type:complete